MSKKDEKVLVEVIEPSDKRDVVYKPSIRSTEGIATRTGNVMPLVNAMQVSGASNGEIVAKVTDVTITGALKNAMAMPNAMMSAGDVIVSNAQAIGKVLLDKAMTGDMNAIREILNRTEGKVPNVTHSSSANVTVKGDANSIAGLMSRIDSNKGQ